MKKMIMILAILFAAPLLAKSTETKEDRLEKLLIAIDEVDFARVAELASVDIINLDDGIFSPLGRAYRSLVNLSRNYVPNARYSSEQEYIASLQPRYLQIIAMLKERGAHKIVDNQEEWAASWGKSASESEEESDEMDGE